MVAAASPICQCQPHDAHTGHDARFKPRNAAGESGIVQRKLSQKQQRGRTLEYSGVAGRSPDNTLSLYSSAAMSRSSSATSCLTFASISVICARVRIYAISTNHHGAVVHTTVALRSVDCRRCDDPRIRHAAARSHIHVCGSGNPCPPRRAREHLHAHLLSLVHLRLRRARGCTGRLSRCLTHLQSRLLCCALRLGHRLLQQLSPCDMPRATACVIYRLQFYGPRGVPPRLGGQAYDANASELTLRVIVPPASGKGAYSPSRQHQCLAIAQNQVRGVAFAVVASVARVLAHLSAKAGPLAPRGAPRRRCRPPAHPIPTANIECRALTQALCCRANASSLSTPCRPGEAGEMRSSSQ
jgi:hypothetical protein